MPVLMFWNTGRGQVTDAIGSLCRRHEVEVLILAELDINSGVLLTGINQDAASPFTESVTVRTRVRLFTRYPLDRVQPISDDGRVSIKHIRPPLGRPLLLVAVHLPSKLHAGSYDQGNAIRHLREQIVAAERKVGHQNTVVIGDFNVDPFDPAMVAADGLHGMMDRQVALRAARTINGISRDFFYNPMWSRLGDDSQGPPGTYYYPSSAPLSFFWHSFDQVLLRPALLSCYRAEGLVVPTEVDGRALRGPAGSGRPGSDHLPVVIRLDTEQETNA